MRLTRISISGYKRLADTSCNVDGPMIAIVGENEAGKSSALEALDWLWNSDGDPLERRARSRDLPDIQDDKNVVSAVFTLSPEDLDQFKGLDYRGYPTTFTVYRGVDGRPKTGVSPAPSRPSEPFAEALETLNEYAESPEGSPSFEIAYMESLLSEVRLLLREPNRTFSSDELNPIANLVDELDTVQPPDAGPHPAAKLLHLLRETLEELKAASPADTMRHALYRQMPDVLLFHDLDRQLASEYDIDTLRANPGEFRALDNVLATAGGSIEELLSVCSTGDVSRIETQIEIWNDILAEKVRPAWRQRPLTVRLKYEGQLVRVLIRESDSRAVTPVSERSDGLRSFIALYFFVARVARLSPPILLIDEAEAHLHLDAQADLMQVLSELETVSKVIYSTHSPACLPPDLGTGVKVVRADPNRSGRSVMSSGFWSDNEPGLSPLLYAMGAGAAAFSAARRAILVEGVSDMILLPTLIRRATGAVKLPYQVAPGISWLRGRDPQTLHIAAELAYLADGDGPGLDYITDLGKLGISTARLFNLPSDQAVEDLVTPQGYLTVVNSLRLEIDPDRNKVEWSDISGANPIATRLSGYLKTLGEEPPGKPVVAQRLLNFPDQWDITSSAQIWLQGFDKEIRQLFDC